MSDIDSFPHTSLSKKERMAIDRQAMPEQEAPTPGRTTSARSTWASRSRLAMLEAQRCLLCPKTVLRRRLPGRASTSRGSSATCQEGDLAGAAAVPARRQRPALRDRPGLPAGEPVRRRLHARQDGRSRSPSATWSASSPTGPQANPDAAGPASATRRAASAWRSSAPGPAGLTAAGELAKCGHDVTVFEALHAPGGVLVYGIPEFRLPKDIVTAEVDRLRARRASRSRRTRSWARPSRCPSCASEFDAVFIAVGAGLPVFMNVPGENLKGVYSANEYLTRVNLMGAWTARTPTRRSSRASGSRWSAAATSPWTRSARPGAWAPTRPSSSTGAATRSCPREPRRSTTPSRRASTSSSWSLRSRSSATTTAGSPDSAASAWSSASPTLRPPPARADRRAPSSSCRATWSSSPSAPGPTRCSPRPPRTSSSTRGATSSPTRRA